MIKAINKNNNQEVNLEVQSPDSLFHGLTLYVAGWMALVSGFGYGVWMQRAAGLLIVIGAIKRRGSIEFNVFYKIPLILLIMDTIVGVAFQIVVASNIELAMNFIVIKIILSILRVISMSYNVFNGRKNHLRKLYDEGFKITNENELSVKEAKLVSKSRA